MISCKICAQISIIYSNSRTVGGSSTLVRSQVLFLCNCHKLWTSWFCFLALTVLNNPNFQTKWPEQSEELLGLIVNSLRALDGAVPQGCPEPRRRPQSAQKIALVLDKAPKHLQPDLVALVPKLVEHSEHPLAACALLDRLQKPDAEPALRIPVREYLEFSFLSFDLMALLRSSFSIP